MIRPFSLEEIARYIDGRLVGEERSDAIDQVSIDSRTLPPGALFVAIRGSRFDGHDFLLQAEQAGAGAAVVEALEPGCALAQILVKDSFRALGLLGRMNREAFAGRVLAVTGSCGKTSVKEMLASILAQDGEVLATRGNLNNGFGVPLTLLELAGQDQAVVELGTSAPGEIQYIADLARPDIAVITNAAETHLLDLKSVAGVAQEKGAIVDALTEKGVAVLNRDDDFFQDWSDRALAVRGRQVISFAIGTTQADVYASHIKTTDQGMRFNLHVRGQVAAVRLAFWGRYQVLNSCCAAAAALAGGVGLDIIVQGLENARPYQRRGLRYQVNRGARRLVIFDESYNANPRATQAAIDHLSECEGLKIMAFGDMLDLGSVAQTRHREIGAYARAAGVHYFAGFGSLAVLACQAFGKEGCHFENKEALSAWVDRLFHNSSEDTVSVLVKGSRGMGMLDVVRSLVGSDYKGEH